MMAVDRGLKMSYIYLIYDLFCRIFKSIEFRCHLNHACYWTCRRSLQSGRLVRKGKGSSVGEQHGDRTVRNAWERGRTGMNRTKRDQSPLSYRFHWSFFDYQEVGTDINFPGTNLARSVTNGEPRHRNVPWVADRHIEIGISPNTDVRNCRWRCRSVATFQPGELC